MFNFFKKKSDQEASFAAGMNFDIEEVRPFLKRIADTVLDAGLTDADIDWILNEIDTLTVDNEEKEIGSFEVSFKGKPARIRVHVEIHIEDDMREVVLHMYSHQQLVDRLDAEMMKWDEEMDE